MPRFKQPGSGISRITDRMGGGGGIETLYVVACKTTRSTSIRVPTGIVSGDFIIVAISDNANAALSISSPGFSLIAQTSGGSSSVIKAYSKVADGSESDLLLSTGGTTIGYTVIVFRGASGSIGSISSASVATTTTNTAFNPVSPIDERSIVFAVNNTNITTAYFENFMFVGGGESSAINRYALISNRRGLTSIPSTNFSQASGPVVSLAMEVLAA